jgi:hypothetical protein
MPSPVKYNLDPNIYSKFIELEEKKIESGRMGRIFGSPIWAGASISWIVILLLTLSGIFSSFVCSSITPQDYWKIITPIITLAFGYLFGNNGAKPYKKIKTKQLPKSHDLS